MSMYFTVGSSCLQGADSVLGSYVGRSCEGFLDALHQEIECGPTGGGGRPRVRTGTEETEDTDQASTRRRGDRRGRLAANLRSCDRRCRRALRGGGSTNAPPTQAAGRRC